MLETCLYFSFFLVSSSDHRPCIGTEWQASGSNAPHVAPSRLIWEKGVRLVSHFSVSSQVKGPLFPRIGDIV